MDLPRHYSLASEEDKHFVIHDKRDNKRFNISKKDIHPATQMKILKMQKLAEGGSVTGDVGLDTEQRLRSDYTGSDKIDTSQRAPPDEGLGVMNGYDDTAPSTSDSVDMSALGPKASASDILSGVATNSPPSSMNTSPDMSTPGASTPPAPPQGGQAPQINPMAGMPTVGSLNGMQGQYEAAAKAGAQGQIAQNQEIMKARAPQLVAQELATQKYQETSEKYQKQAEQLSADIAAQKIDPKRYWNSKSTESKWMAGIGILLGGYAQGMMGSTHNMALDVIQGHIDRDIDAQKSELGKKQTLLSDNFRMQGNLAAAESATRAQYESIMQGKLAMIAAKTNNPMILAGMQKEILDSKMRMMQYLQPVAQNQMVMQLRDSLNKGGAQGQDPATYVPYLVPEQRQQEVFKEIDNAQNTKRNRQAIGTAFENAAKTLNGVDFVPGMQNRYQKEYQASLGPTFKDVEGTVRQAAMDNMFDKTTPQFGDNKATIDAKRRALNTYISSKMSAPTAKGFGIDLQKFESTQQPGPGSQMEGKTATNAQGQRIIMQNGRWVPVGR